jgi:hypothetical protein
MRPVDAAATYWPQLSMTTIIRTGFNGHQARAYWNTPGRETTGSFEVRLPPGTYHLAFSNKFSLLADKEIFLNADLNYKKAETYYDDPSAQPINCPVPPCTQATPYHANMPDVH